MQTGALNNSQHYWANNFGTYSASWEGYIPSKDLGDHVFSQQCWKSCANESNIVAPPFGDQGTNEMLGVVASKVLPVIKFGQKLPTRCNNMQEREKGCENGRNM